MPVTTPGKRDWQDQQERDRLAAEERVALTSAAMPRTSAIAVAIVATMNELRIAVRIAGLFSASPNQWKVKPLGGRLDAAGVERVDRQDDQRDVEERQHPECRKPERDPRARDLVIGGVSQRLECAESTRHEEVDGHDHDRQQRVGRRQQQVAEGRVVVDHVADELRIRDQVGRDVVAERQ